MGGCGGVTESSLQGLLLNAVVVSASVPGWSRETAELSWCCGIRQCVLSSVVPSKARGAAGGCLEGDCFGRHWQNLLKAVYSLQKADRKADRQRQYMAQDRV